MEFEVQWIILDRKRRQIDNDAIGISTTGKLLIMIRQSITIKRKTQRFCTPNELKKGWGRSTRIRLISQEKDTATGYQE